MKKTFLLLSLLIIVLSFSTKSLAQKPSKMGDAVQTKSPTKPASPFALPAELVEFYTGTWEGKGKFADGKPIEADVTYTTELDDEWLVFHHADRPPIPFKAVGTVGIDRESKKMGVVDDRQLQQRQVICQRRLERWNSSVYQNLCTRANYQTRAVYLQT